MPSQVVDEIRGRIETQLTAATSVVLDETAIGILNIGELFEVVLAASSLTVTDASITIDGDSFSINGTSVIFGSIPKPVVITFLDSGGLNIRLAGGIENQIRLSDIEGQLFKDFRFLPTRLGTLQFDSFTIEVIPDSETVKFAIKDQSSLDLSGGLLTLEEPTLMLSGSQVTSNQPSVDLLLQGTLVIADKRFLSRALFGTNVTGQAPFTVTPLTDTLTLSRVVQHFLGISIAQLPDLTVSDLQLSTDIDSNNFDFRATLEGDWDLSLGISSLRLSSLTTQFRRDAGVVSGSIQGNTNIAETEATIQGDLQSDFVLSGQIGQINLVNLLESIYGSVSVSSDFPTIQLPSGSFQIQLNTNEPIFVVGSSLSDFGILIATVKRIAGQWQYAVAFALPPDWKFSRLLPLLKPLDELKIAPPKLLLASFSDESFQFPSLPGLDVSSSVERGLREGIVLSSALSLDGFGLNFIGTLTGINELPLSLVIGDTIAESEVKADLGITITVVPNVITFDEFSLIIDPSPFSIAFSCTAKVIIFDEELPRFSTAIVLDENSQRIVFETKEAWETPFGISGLTINQVILDIETLPQRKFGVLGDVSISDKRIRIACQFTEGYPSGLVGELIGKLSLSEIVQDLVGLTLPPIIDISVSDFKIYIVADPLGMTIGSEHFEPGLALQGLFETFGVGMFVKIKISQENGVYAHGSLKQKIELGNVFIVSNVSGDGPPEMTLDTANEPYLRISGMVFLLGLKKSIDATLNNSGFSLRIEENLGIARYELDCIVNSLSNFRTTGSFSFGLRAEIGPIQLTSAGPSLGKIKLDTGFDGSLDISLVDRVFSARIEGRFSFVGTSFNLPTISLSVSPQSLEEIPEFVKQKVIEEAKDIFQELFTDAGKWLQAVGEELIEIAGDAIEKAKQVAQALRNQFNQGAEEVGTAIRNTLDLGSRAAAEGLKSIGENAARIATVLKDLGDELDEVSSILKDLDYDSGVVGDALKAAGFPSADVDNIVRILFPIPPIIVPHVDIHTDTPIIPGVSLHGDSPVIPAVSLHVDVGHGDAHGDAVHVDAHGDAVHVDAHGDAAHVDAHGDAGHGDSRGVHGDAHTDVWRVKAHIDNWSGPHIDTKLVKFHSDTKAVNFHSDTQAVNFHSDTQAVNFHVDDAAVGTHTDTPEVGHIDAHTDTPEVGHGDVHGDVL